MRNELISPLKRIQLQQDSIFKELEKIDLEILKLKPSENAWSSIEVVQHIYLIELMSLKYIQKKLQFIDYLPNRKILSLLRYALMKLVLQTPAKFKAPKSKLKAEFNSLQEAQLKWAELRADLEKTLEKIPNSVINGLLWKHPLAGKMSVNHMLLFFHDHSERHKKQIERTLAVVSQNNFKNEKILST